MLGIMKTEEGRKLIPELGERKVYRESSWEGCSQSRQFCWRGVWEISIS